jgi:hypothetical protein
MSHSAKCKGRKLSRLRRMVAAKTKVAGKLRVWAIASLCLVLSAAGLGIATRSRAKASASPAHRPAPAYATAATAATGVTGAVSLYGGLRARLSFQPEADNFRRRLGTRFLVPGQELAVLGGTLTIGSQAHSVLVTRRQDDDTERIAIATDGAAASLTWDGISGAIYNGAAASGNERQICERVALDSPDQFILAQLRGASYQTIARGAMPPESAGQDSYTGPVWDVVRLAEPRNGSANPPESSARTFHINTNSGLIDRVFSQEQGQIVVAEISGWIKRGTEVEPTHTVWKQSGQAVMELTITSSSHGPKQ